MIKYFLIGRYLNSDTWPAVIPRLLQLELISPSPDIILMLFVFVCHCRSSILIYELLVHTWS